MLAGLADQVDIPMLGGDCTESASSFCEAEYWFLSVMTSVLQLARA